MKFEWDPDKDASSQRKHLVSLRQAAEIFLAFRLVRDDLRWDYGERRLIALGLFDGEVLRVVYTQRNGAIRIISAWKASKHDRETYRAASQLQQF